MADETLQTTPLDNNNVDSHIMTLFERLEAINRDNQINALNNRLSNAMQPRKSMQAEIRTLEFWRSIIGECLASFFYVFIVCGAAAGAGVGASVSSVLLATALASGLTMGTLTQCFLHISGAHINPAVTLASCVIRYISPIRATMYITAQCGGGIAGAALLYGVTVPGYQGNLQAAISHSASFAAWERFGVEFILTFVVVLTYFMSTDSIKKVMGHSASSIAAAYSACSFVSMPYLNPARSLGPSFVLNKWDNHWVYWFGPLVGGFASGIVYEYVFNNRRGMRNLKMHVENDSSSANSEDDLNYDLNVEKQNVHSKYSNGYEGTGNNIPGNGNGVNNGQNGNNINSGNYCQNLYTVSPPTFNKCEQSEPLYGGTRSMYCRSPTLTRASLNRSQSVYTKSNTILNREILPRSGPLVPAQSLYPLRIDSVPSPSQQQQQQHQLQSLQQQQLEQSSHLQNQNVQNQFQQRSENIYGLRNSMKQPQKHHQQTHQNLLRQPTQHLEQNMQQQQLLEQQPLQQQRNLSTLSNQQQQNQPGQENQINYQAVYGTRHNLNPNNGHLKHPDRRPESLYGISAPRRRGQSTQSDDSSYGSYHGSCVTSPSRNLSSEPPILLYAPPSNPNSVANGQPTRTQSERKVTTPVVKGSSQASVPMSSATMGQYNVNQTHAGNIQQQHQHQIVNPQQQQQQQQHYNMMNPVRPN